MLVRVLLSGASVLPWFAGARRRRLEEGDISLSYLSLGYGAAERETWVLLHGLGGIAATWHPVFRALARDCRIVAPELSALGGTRAPEGGLTIGQGAHAVARLIEEELGGRQVTVAGLSLGGWMAVRLALLRPDLVSRLVLVDAAGYRDQDWEQIIRLVTIRDMASVDRLYPALFARTTPLTWLSRGVFLHTYTSPGALSLLGRTDERDAYDDADLARLAMPVALIWGEQDGLFTVETARAMASALPRPYLEVLANCGHASHLDRPRQLVAAIQRFRQATRDAGTPAARPARPARRFHGDA